MFVVRYTTTRDYGDGEDSRWYTMDTKEKATKCIEEQDAYRARMDEGTPVSLWSTGRGDIFLPNEIEGMQLHELECMEAGMLFRIMQAL